MPQVQSLVRKQILHATWTVWPKKKKKRVLWKGCKHFQIPWAGCDLWTLKPKALPLSENPDPGSMYQGGQHLGESLAQVNFTPPKCPGWHLLALTVVEVTWRSRKYSDAQAPARGSDGMGLAGAWTRGLKSPMGIGMCNSLKTGLNNRGGERRSKETFSSEWPPAKDLAHVLRMLGPWV